MMDESYVKNLPEDWVAALKTHPRWREYAEHPPRENQAPAAALLDEWHARHFALITILDQYRLKDDEMADPLSGLYFALLRDMEDLRDINAYIQTTIKTADAADSSLQ